MLIRDYSWIDFYLFIVQIIIFWFMIQEEISFQPCHFLLCVTDGWVGYASRTPDVFLPCLRVVNIAMSLKKKVGKKFWISRLVSYMGVWAFQCEKPFVYLSSSTKIYVFIIMSVFCLLTSNLCFHFMFYVSSPSLFFHTNTDLPPPTYTLPSKHTTLFQRPSDVHVQIKSHRNRIVLKL